MPFGIKRLVLGSNKIIDITEEDFNAIKTAQYGLLESLTIEEKLNLVIENYAEFEKELLEETLNYMLFKELDWSSFMGNIYTINRRIVNCLSACRMYLDQIPQNLNSIYGQKSDASEAFKKKTNEEYDSHLSYRVLEVSP